MCTFAQCAFQWINQAVVRCSCHTKHGERMGGMSKIPTFPKGYESRRVRSFRCFQFNGVYIPLFLFFSSFFTDLSSFSSFPFFPPPSLPEPLGNDDNFR